MTCSFGSRPAGRRDLLMLYDTGMERTMGRVHDYWKKIHTVFAAACAVSLFISSHALAGIVESGELTEPSFWILNNNAGDSVVLDEEEIKSETAQAAANTLLIFFQ